MEFLHDLARTYPLMRGGAILFILVGLGIIIGGFGRRRWMLGWLIGGAVAAVLAMAGLSITKVIFAGLGSPSPLHWIIMGIGFAVEFCLVNYVVFTIKDHDSREFWLWMLVVVGAHFLVFTFSHGPFAGALGLICIANALIGLRLKRVDFHAFWIVDGFLKLAVGCAMLAATLV
ncbi:MAG TPA: DUF6609 family protein [Candidatus Saccharimonadia bacterium]|nr:DUF6609 family protein [Candidatus Saccharimonadia bacterium]